MRLCMHPSTLSDMNISATSRPIAITFYMKHHLVGEKAALGFGPDQIGTLVSMAPDSMTTLGQRSFSVVDSVGPTLETDVGPT